MKRIIALIPARERSVRIKNKNLKKICKLPLIWWTLEAAKKSKYVDNYKIIKESYIEGSVIKTIAAFLNSKGGNLFIGVSDDNEIIGLEVELKKFHNGSSDKFLLHLNNLINIKFSEIITHLLDIKLINCNEKLIIQVSVTQSPKEVFVDNTKFYVRANPATEELKGAKMITYIKQNFD